MLKFFLLNYECLLCRIAILTSAHQKSSAFLQTILTTNIFGAILSRDCLLMMCVAHYTYTFFKLNLIAFRCKYSAGMFKSTLFFTHLHIYAAKTQMDSTQRHVPLQLMSPSIILQSGNGTLFY